MTTKLVTWASNDGHPTKIKQSDGCGRKPLRRQRNSGMITMDLKAIWEMSVKILHGTDVEERVVHSADRYQFLRLRPSY